MMQDKLVDQHEQGQGYHVDEPKPVFTVSTTGHRNIGCDANNERVQEAVTQSLKIIDAVIHTTRSETQCRLLTALAAGADQVGANALNACEMLCSWAMHVVLPFDNNQYRETLGAGLTTAQTEMAQTGFDNLLTKAERTFEIADWTLPTEQPLTLTENHWRNKRFHTLGDLLVRQSDMVIAIWRGTPAAGVGGTADVVGLALQRGVPVLRIDPETLHYSLLLPEARLMDPVASAQRNPGVASLKPIIENEIKKRVEATLLPPFEYTKTPAADSLNAFIGGKMGAAKRETCAPRSPWFAFAFFVFMVNLIAAAFQAITLRFRKRPRWPGFFQRTDYLKDQWVPNTGNRTAVQMMVDHEIHQTVIAADAIATARGYVYRSSYVIIFLGVVLAVWVGLAGLLFENIEKWWFVGAELIILAGLAGFYIMANRYNWHRCWLNAREVTERLRGARYYGWLGIGGRRPTTEGAPWSIWLTNAIMAVPGIPDGIMTSVDIAKIAKELRTFHVDHQVEYHKRNSQKLEQLHHHLDLLGRACLIIAVSCGVLYLFFFGPYPLAFADQSHPTDAHGNTAYDAKNRAKYWVTAIAAGFPMLAAALAGIRYQGDFERFAKRSHETMVALEIIQKKLEAVERRAIACIGSCEAAEPPLFEELMHIIVDIADIYEADLKDWRFVYAARPSPEPG